MTVHGGETLAALRAESAANEAEALAELITGLEAVLPALERESHAGRETDGYAGEVARRDGVIDALSEPADEAVRRVAEGIERLRVEIAAASTGAGTRAPAETGPNSQLETALDALLALQMPGGGFGAAAGADWERASVIATAAAARAAMAALALAQAATVEPGAGGGAARAVELAMAWLFAAWTDEGFGEHPGTPPQAASTAAALGALRDYARVRREAR